MSKETSLENFHRTNPGQLHFVWFFQWHRTCVMYEFWKKKVPWNNVQWYDTEGEVSSGLWRHCRWITLYNDNISNVSTESDWKQFLTKYSGIFKGELESLPGQVHLEVDKIVIAHMAASRHRLVSMIPWVNKELEEFWDWNSWIVIISKKFHDIQICIDPRHLSKYISVRGVS